MLDFMLKNSFHQHSGAEAHGLGALPAVASLRNLSVVLGLVVVVLISILISHPHAAPA